MLPITALYAGLLGLLYLVLAFRVVAVRRAASIGLDAIRKASADVERYCQLHASRRTRSRNHGNSEAATARIAGYWCTWDPEP